MLASRGFDYRSAKTAGEGNHYHKNCRCKVIPGFDGMEVEGYDEDEWYNRWRAFEEIDNAPGLSVKARQSAKEFLSSMPMTDEGEIDRAVAAALARAEADTYNERINRAWQKFRKEKTPENYDATMGAALRKIGERSGAKFSAEYMAQPDGDELWLASKIAANDARFLYATREHKNPDAYIDGVLTEFKTVQSARKLASRLKDAYEKFESYPGVDRVCAVSLLRYEGDTSLLKEVAERFIADGTLDNVYFIGPE
jgi:hypothetical protein